MDKNSKQFLSMKPGYRTALADGTMVPDSPKHMATEQLYHAFAGDSLQICNSDYLYAVAIFSTERKEEYIYSYAYQKEENWTTYTQNLTPDSYIQTDYIFAEECYFRVCVKRKDDADLKEKDLNLANRIMAFYSCEKTYQEKACFQEEIRLTVETIKKEQATSDMKLCILSDTHYTVNGTWEDTVHNIRAVAEQAEYDAIIHLGDLTDGMLSKEMTSRYVKNILADLEKCKAPVYITIGNHDSNYFRNRGNAFSVAEMCELYRLHGNEKDNTKAEERLDYYIDYPEKGVRMIFLSSFDDLAPVRYGYADQQLTWLRYTLGSAERGTKFLIFSHDAPLGKLDYWSFHIRNGEELLDILEEFNRKDEYQIIGFFYGHTHADYVFEECSFPVISIGCAKLEYFLDKKPEGAVTPYRAAGTVSQDLWDSLLIDFKAQKLHLIRFGAGEDRKVSFAKKNFTYTEVRKRQRAGRTMKIWAHRGASGHAPENTMPAFELAYKMGADGIELDVQLTKDGVPVVIHDERIDRVCDGTGFVRDYTLEQLQAFNANKNFPAYGKVPIPTLEEVYAFVKSTDMTINVELKNSVYFYDKLEEKVLELTHRMGVEDRIIYSSFNHYSMCRLKELKPDAKIAFLYSDGILDIADYVDKYKGCAAHPAIKNTEYPDVVKACHDKGIKVHVWTVNEAADIERMRELGVDAVITNYIERG